MTSPTLRARSGHRLWRSLGLALLVSGSAALAGPAGTLAGTEPSQPGECPGIMRVGRVVKGMQGTGWTVVTGSTPRPFQVEVLGVAPDAIGPGRAMIIIEVSDAPGEDFIDRAGGIWAGMSGSPVYVNNRLIGAVAWGFTTGPSPIGGVTPASDMQRLLGYPDAAGAGTGKLTLSRLRIPQKLRRQMTRRAGLPESAAASFDRLPVPLSVSGVRSRMRQRLERSLARGNGSFLAMPGARAPRPAAGAPAARPVPGGNFLSVISYGDVTAAGIATMTYVCDDQALGFGHPMQFVGPATFGANDGDALAIVRDPAFGSSKMANVGASFGTVDQDRLAGLRADLRATPDLIPVTSSVRSIDLRRTREGRTFVTSSGYVPAIAPAHLFSNIDSTMDRFGEGSALLEITVRGRRAGGQAWTLRRTDRIASSFDVSAEAASALEEELLVIGSNQFEDVTFRSVSATTELRDSFQLLNITRVRVSRNGGPFVSPSLLRVSPGDQLVLRVTLRRFRGPQRTARIRMTVPTGAIGDGSLTIVGGNDIFGTACDVDPGACPNSLPQLLRQMANEPRNDEVVATLSVFGGESSRPVAEARRLMASVVAGTVEIPVLVE
jgi:hypothetical protein